MAGVAAAVISGVTALIAGGTSATGSAIQSNRAKTAAAEAERKADIFNKRIFQRQARKEKQAVQRAGFQQLAQRRDQVSQNNMGNMSTFDDAFFSEMGI